MSEDATQAKPDAPAEPAGDAATLSPELQDLGERLIAALKTVHDPEIPVDIYELGLIYKVDVADVPNDGGSRDVTVDMTLTAPACPVAAEMPEMVKTAVETVAGVGKVTVNMTFEPPWTPEKMSDEAKLELNMY